MVHLSAQPSAALAQRNGAVKAAAAASRVLRGYVTGTVGALEYSGAL